MKRLKIRVYEIEHDGDLDNACEELHQYGATSIKVIETDFEGGECALIEIQVPEDKLDEFKRNVMNNMCV